MTKRNKWLSIVAVVLVIVSVVGILGINKFTKPSSGTVNNDVDDGSINGGNTSDNVSTSKIGKYRDAEGTLKYVYDSDYTKLTDSELGFSTVRGSLGNTTSSPVWSTLMFDRNYDPYLSFGKSIDNQQYDLVFEPYSESGKTIVFETDFCYMGSKGAGADCSDSDPTWHTDIMLNPAGDAFTDVSIRFYDYDEKNYLLSVNNRDYDLGYYKIGEWYNMRVEIIPGNSSEESDYKIYIDNVLKLSFSGTGFQTQITDLFEVDIKLRKSSLGANIYIDNTFVSKVN